MREMRAPIGLQGCVFGVANAHSRPVVSLGELRSSPIGAQIARVAREEPVVAVEIGGSVLELGVDGLVEVFDDGGSGGVCVVEAGVHL